MDDRIPGRTGFFTYNNNATQLHLRNNPRKRRMSLRDGTMNRKIEIPSSNDTLRAILKDAGLRCTQGRIEVLRILLNSEDPMTHEEVSAHLSFSLINRVTVYRVLESFLHAGIVHRVEAGGRVWRFAVCGRMHQGHCHPHFICRECGRIECLADCPMPAIPQLVPPHTIEEQEVYLRGLCPECAS